MKKTSLSYSIALLLFLSLLCFSVPGCGDKPKQGNSRIEPTVNHLNPEEMKKIDLYVAVLKATFTEGNGGDSFIAVKLDSLDGLSDDGKQQVLRELETLADKIYDYESIKDNPALFLFDVDGRKMATRGGTLLYLSGISYEGNTATLTGVSWFGNVGAVYPKYEAFYNNGEWHLKLISMAIS